MEYKFEHHNYNNFDVFEDKKLPARAYFIPHTSKGACEETTYLDERYKSKKILMLNGEWDFQYFRNIYQVPKGKIDLDRWAFDKVNVPSMWQFTGYEEPFYVNQRYQFPLDPPNIPGEMPLERTPRMQLDTKDEVVLNNSLGIYRRKFTIDSSNKNYIVTFLGVCSNAEVYVNGEYVGYSEGSHNTAEFDISRLVKKGENEIVVLVYKWCNGTYLECQDMFRNNGIFRDVYITEYDDTYIWDYRVTTVKVDRNKYHVALDSTLRGELDGVSLRYTLLDGRKIKCSQELAPIGTFKESHALFETDVDVEEWSAENPKLYTLYIELVRNNRAFECVRQEVGFKKVHIDGNVFKFNDTPIKLLGVNHHDTTEDKGYVMTVDEMLRDVRLMKEYNVNAVRMSHYPPDPLFIKMANHYGLYIVDEADIETHGTYGVWGIYKEHMISNDLRWKEHYLDRVMRMYERDKNNASITMWSLGNEAGGYKCQDYCYNCLKKKSPIPIHYEGVSRTKRWAYDVVSRMYFTTEGYEDYINGKLPKKYYDKPYYQCEYAHAMGVGPGSLERYVDLFYKSEGLMGGCIWEWADHAIKHKKRDKYRYEYTYGGDHGEYEHDKNFCVDGLIYPDRTPSMSTFMMKEAYRPIKTTKVGAGEYEIWNRMAFTNLKVFDIKWELVIGGDVAESGIINVDVQGGDKEVVKVPHSEVRDDQDAYITFRHIREGREVSFEQIELNKYLKLDDKKSKTALGMHIIDTDDMLGVRFNNGNIMFNKIDGTLQSYSYNGVEYVSQKPSNPRCQKGIIPCIYRAPIDNYMYVRKGWEKIGLDKAHFAMCSISTPIAEGNHYLINVVFNVLGLKGSMLSKHDMKFVYTYKVHEDGVVDVDVRVENKGKTIDMPRIGSILEMPKEFCNTRYYGLGGVENYSDAHEHALMGIFEKKVGEYEGKYIKPQDSGNMSEVRWAEITNKAGDGIRVTAKYKPMNFKATRVEDSVLMKAMHREDVYESDNTIVHIDGFMRGVGSNSCGPDTRNEYRYYLDKSYTYSFRLAPIMRED